MNTITYSKSGSKIHIKNSTKGSFTKYCKGKVTQECIDKAKRSGNKKLIKKAVFAANSRKWSKKHQIGGSLLNLYLNYMNSQNQKLLNYTQQESLRNTLELINHAQKLKQALNFGQSVGNLLGYIQGSLIPEEVEDNSVDDLAQERVNQIQKTIQNDVKKQNEQFVKKTKDTFNNTFKLPVINSTELLADNYLENITN